MSQGCVTELVGLVKNLAAVNSDPLLSSWLFWRRWNRMLSGYMCTGRAMHGPDMSGRNSCEWALFHMEPVGDVRRGVLAWRGTLPVTNRMLCTQAHVSRNKSECFVHRRTLLVINRAIHAGLPVSVLGRTICPLSHGRRIIYGLG